MVMLKSQVSANAQTSDQRKRLPTQIGRLKHNSQRPILVESMLGNRIKNTDLIAAHCATTDLKTDSKSVKGKSIKQV